MSLDLLRIQYAFATLQKLQFLNVILSHHFSTWCYVCYSFYSVNYVIRQLTVIFVASIK